MKNRISAIAMATLLLIASCGKDNSSTTDKDEIHQTITYKGVAYDYYFKLDSTKKKHIVNLAKSSPELINVMKNHHPKVTHVINGKIVFYDNVQDFLAHTSFTEAQLKPRATRETIGPDLPCENKTGTGLVSILGDACVPYNVATGPTSGTSAFPPQSLMDQQLTIHHVSIPGYHNTAGTLQAGNTTWNPGLFNQLPDFITKSGIDVHDITQVPGPPSYTGGAVINGSVVGPPLYNDQASELWIDLIKNDGCQARSFQFFQGYPFNWYSGPINCSSIYYQACPIPIHVLIFQDINYNAQPSDNNLLVFTVDFSNNNSLQQAFFFGNYSLSWSNNWNDEMSSYCAFQENYTSTGYH